jgi:hypothetical protein
MTKAKQQIETEQPKHIETAAEKYRKLKNQQFDQFIDESFTPEVLSAAQIEPITVPSGMDWQIRRLDADFYTAAGTMPMHLANKVKGADGEPNPAAVANLTQEEHDRLMELSWKSLFYGCVSPRIVITATEPDHIAIDDVLMGDFQFLTEALLKGGKEAERLYTFRRKR